MLGKEKDDGACVRTETGHESAPAGAKPALRSIRFGNGPAALFGCWLALFGAALLLYWPGLRAGYFSDDLLFFFYSPPSHLYQYFASPGGSAQAYRPLEAIILTLIQQHYRFDTLPIHLISLGAHAALCCAVLAASRRLGLSLVEGWIACVFVLIAQVGPPAVLGNDTMSQAVSTCLGVLSILFLYLGWRREGPLPARVSIGWLTASVAAYTASLFFKETALGFLIVAFLLLGVIALAHRTWTARVKTAILLAAPYCAATLLYLAARLHAGAAVSQSGSYRIHMGANIVRNLAEFGLAAFAPMSTVDGAVAAVLHRTPLLILDAFGCLLICGVLAAGIVASRRWMLALWLVAAALASLFPAYLLTHVSELYLYNAIPFLSLLAGVAFAALWRKAAWGRVAAVLAAGLLAGGEIYADRQKTDLMAQNGRRAAAIYAGIARSLPALPPHSRILLVNPENRIPEYSVFLLQGFDVVDLGNLRIGPILGRPDVRVELLNESRAHGLEQRRDQLLLALATSGGVKVYKNEQNQ
jgi:hypothetical protein